MSPSPFERPCDLTSELLFPGDHLETIPGTWFIYVDWPMFGHDELI